MKFSRYQRDEIRRKKCEIQLGRLIFMQVWSEIEEIEEIEKLEDKWCDKMIDRWRKKKTHTELKGNASLRSVNW